ncbi:MAG: ROK family protein [Ilumatobacteraceae bacterium]
MRRLFAKSSPAAPNAFLAVDVGGTKLAVGIVTVDGELIERSQVPTPAHDVWDALRSLIDHQLANTSCNIVACGVGCGGPMSMNGQLVSTLHIPEWRNFPLQSKLSRHIGYDTYIYNDAQAFVLGEQWRGHAVGEKNVIGMVVSTGIGGGIILDGLLVRGRLGNAGHIGHVIVEPNGHECACGSRGCLEAHASGSSIAAFTGMPAVQATRQVVEHAGQLVGRALASVGAIVDARLAVVGGSVALGFGSPFFAAAQQELDEHARLDFISGMRVVPAGLGDSAPLIGAAAVAKYGRALA